MKQNKQTSNMHIANIEQIFHLNGMLWFSISVLFDCIHLASSFFWFIPILFLHRLQLNSSVHNWSMSKMHGPLQNLKEAASKFLLY